MKNTVSIALIALLLFNVLGYQALFFGLQRKSEKQFSQQVLNERFEANQTITLKIPVALPYSYNQENFQKAEGKFEYKGNHYQLVAQRMYNDTLQVVCLYDEGTTKVKKDYTDFVKSLADQSATNHHKASTPPSFIKEYLGSGCSIRHVNTGWISSLVYYIREESLIPSFCASIIHPPERA